MNGLSSAARRAISQKEKNYLDNLVRGTYAKVKISEGTVITHENYHEYFFQAIPLQKAQCSGRENIVGGIISKNLEPGDGLFVDGISNLDALRDIDPFIILNRGRDGERDTALKKTINPPKANNRCICLNCICVWRNSIPKHGKYLMRFADYIVAYLARPRRRYGFYCYRRWINAFK